MVWASAKKRGCILGKETGHLLSAVLKIMHTVFARNAQMLPELCMLFIYTVIYHIR